MKEKVEVNLDTRLLSVLKKLEVDWCTDLDALINDAVFQMVVNQTDGYMDTVLGD